MAEAKVHVVREFREFRTYIALLGPLSGIDLFRVERAIKPY